MFQSATRPVQTSEGIPLVSPLDKPLPLRQLLTYPVFISLANFAYLQFLDSSHTALAPLFFAMPIEIGGLGFDPRHIGYIMGISRAINAIFMASFFSKLVRYLGERWTYVLAMSTFQLLWFLFPMMNICARYYGISTGVWTGILLWIIPATSSDIAFGKFYFPFSYSDAGGLKMLHQLLGCIFVFITAAAPNRRSLGATQGLAQTSVAIARIIGPSLSTSLFSFSVEQDLLGGYAVYAVFSFLSCFSVWLALRLPHDIRPTWEREGNNPRCDD